MRLYLDDDAASALLTKLLRKSEHDVQIPADIGASGAPDPLHLTSSIADNRACLTKNHDDFWLLHNLIQLAQGRHPGIFVVRQDNDPTRDLTPKGIVRAIRKCEAAGVPVENQFIILNQWR
jgi:hypothetical protein